MRVPVRNARGTAGAQRPGRAVAIRTARDVRRRREHLHEAIGVAIRQRPQQDGADDAEDGGVGADAERERDHGDGGEARRPPQRAQRRARRSRRRSSSQMNVRASRCRSLRVRDAAERAPRREARLVRGHAAAPILVLEQGEVRVDLARDFRLGAIAAKRTFEQVDGRSVASAGLGPAEAGHYGYDLVEEQLVDQAGEPAPALGLLARARARRPW